MTQRRPKATRIMVNLSPEVYGLIEAISRESKVSMGGLCGEMLTAAVPAFQAMLEAFKLAKEQSDGAFDVLHRAIVVAQKEATETQLDLIDTKARMNRRPKGPEEKAVAKPKRAAKAPAGAAKGKGTAKPKP